MPINIVCPGCKKRFSVSDKFAGKQGPCPKCKTVIKIPKKEDEIVVHAPETSGPKDSEGRSVLAPIERQETKFSYKVAVVVTVLVAATFVAALMLRNDQGPHPAVLVVGAVLLGPLIALSGYTFLRNDELEPYRGQELILRVLACGAAYAFLWGVYWWIQWVLEMQFEMNLLVFIAPIFVLAGGFAALASLELDFLMGVLHYGLYLLVTVSLCFIMDVPIFMGG